MWQALEIFRPWLTNLLIKAKSPPFIAALHLLRVHTDALCSIQEIIRHMGAAGLLPQAKGLSFPFFLSFFFFKDLGGVARRCIMFCKHHYRGWFCFFLFFLKKYPSLMVIFLEIHFHSRFCSLILHEEICLKTSQIVPYEMEKSLVNHRHWASSFCFFFLICFLLFNFHR